MKTKNFFLMAVMLLLSVSAFAQEDIYDYYLGLATEEQIQDQSYINSLAYNQSGVKPTTLDFKLGYNVLIVPSDWGTPRVADSAGFLYTSYKPEELGITNPSGKSVFVYESSEMTATATWESSGTTSISNTRILKEDGAYHSLKGQRVNNPSNGIYIQNGKKILVK